MPTSSSRASAGSALTFFDTSPEAHAIDSAVYKVQIHPPGTKLSPNGLPVAHLYYRNDDGGPGYGADSLLHFTAPADGEYILRIRDSQGLGGDDYAYRLTVRRPRPDFRLTSTPRNPNVPAGRRGAGDGDRVSDGRIRWRHRRRSRRPAGRTSRGAGHDPSGTDYDHDHSERGRRCQRVSSGRH